MVIFLYMEGCRVSRSEPVVHVVVMRDELFFEFMISGSASIIYCLQIGYVTCSEL